MPTNLLRIFFFLLLSSAVLKAQSPSFLDSTASWNMELSFFRDFNSPPPLYHAYELGDTQQIGSYDYRALNYKGPGLNGTFAYIREQGSQVYMRIDSAVYRLPDSLPYSTEFLVYDFGLKLGDTIPLRIYNGASQPNGQKDFYYSVTQIDSVEIFAGKRKRLILRHLYPQDSGWVFSDTNRFIPLCLDSLNWIEGVGSDYSPIYNMDARFCFLNPVSWMSRDFLQTTCHTKNGQLLYQPFGACENISLPEAKPLLRFSVHPNPAQDFIQLKADAPIVRLSWLNLQGQLLQEIEAPSVEQDFSHLKSGLYLLLVQFEDGRRIINKVLVHD